MAHRLGDRGRRLQPLPLEPIAGKRAGSVQGASYGYLDRRVRPGVSYAYRLQLADLRGGRSFARSVSLPAVRSDGGTR